MVKIWSNIPIPIRIVGGTLAVIYSMQLGMHYVESHNRENEGIYKLEVKKIDGAFDYTKFERNTEHGTIEDILLKFRTFTGSKVYHDGGPYGDHDGKVDKIFLSIGIFGLTSKILDRILNYDTHKELFDRADEELYGQKIRFKDYFDFKFENEKIPPIPEVEKW